MAKLCDCAKKMAERVIEEQAAAEHQKGWREEYWYDIWVDYSDSVKQSDPQSMTTGRNRGNTEKKGRTSKTYLCNHAWNCGNGCQKCFSALVKHEECLWCPLSLPVSKATRTDPACQSTKLGDRSVLQVFFNNALLQASMSHMAASIHRIPYQLKSKTWNKINKANLRDLIAATGLVISNWIQIVNFSARVTVKFDGWPCKTIGHLFYATSSFVHLFVPIGEFKLKLQSGNAQSGSNWMIFRAVRPWNLTDDLAKQ